MSLTLSEQPGFTALVSSTWNTGAGLTDTNLKAMNANAIFGAVRNEQFWGYYRNGETVVLPVSPADGYQYSLSELRFTWSIFWTGAATGPLLGTQSLPSRGATSGAGTLLQMGFLVDQGTGNVTCNVSYYKTAQTDTNDGILLVITHAQRNR